jgi:hypothetical protein
MHMTGSYLRHPSPAVMRIKLALVTFAAFAALACSDSVTEPHRFGDALPIEVSPLQDGNTPQTTRFGSDGGLIYFRGTITTPDPCYDLAAYRTIDGRELRVTIVATRRARQANSCATTTGSFSYETLTDMPGCPHLTLWYHFEGADWPDQKRVDQNWCG